MRNYIDAPVHIDGRNIPYPVCTAGDYLKYHDHVEDLDDMFDNHYEICEYITQILGLKQSCFLLRHTTHCCQSVSDSMLRLKERLIKELSDKHNYVFDEAWVDTAYLRTMAGVKVELSNRLSCHGIKPVFIGNESPVVFIPTATLNAQEIKTLLETEGFSLIEEPVVLNRMVGSSRKEGFRCVLKMLEVWDGNN